MKNLFTDRFSAFFCTVLFLLVVAVPILWQVLPKSDFSPEENRMLTSCPYLSKESLLSGEYTAALSQYLSDHLPARTALLKIKSAAEYAALKRENNRVIAAENGYLIKRFD